MARLERSVIIAEIEFRYAKVSADVILAAHGIHPRQPYTHEHLTLDGGAAHRFIQPPRPEKRAAGGIPCA